MSRLTYSVYLCDLCNGYVICSNIYLCLLSLLQNMHVHCKHGMHINVPVCITVEFGIVRCINMHISNLYEHGLLVMIQRNKESCRCIMKSKRNTNEIIFLLFDIKYY